MSDTTWTEIERLFHEAVELDAADLEPFLLSATEREDIRAEVRSLVEAAAEETLLERAVREAEPWSDESGGRQRIGQTLGDYHLLDVLGRGGMGTVYLAERVGQEFEQKVAVKVARRGMPGAQMQARFLAERRILASLHHPHIAQLLDGGTSPEGQPYLVMEYLEGEPIDRYCARQRLGMRERITLFLEVCDAVQYAHEKLVIHRDIKPNNVFIVSGSPKLLDFGIAKLLDPEAAHVLGPETVLAGRPLTPAYASPEQIRGEVMNTASDVYSLGIVLYELLTGTCPTPEDPSDPMRQKSSTVAAPLAAPSTRLRELATAGQLQAAAEHWTESVGRRVSMLRGELDTILLKALRFEPERRYGTVAAFAGDLRNYLADRPISARRDSWSYRTSKFVQRNRTPVAAGSVAAVLLTTLAISSSVMASRLRAERDAVLEEQRRSESMIDFLTGLFGDIAPSASRGEELTATQILDRGAARLAAMGDEPEIQARLALTLGNVQLERADFARSAALFDQAVEADVAGPLRGLARSSRAMLLFAQGDFDEAEALAREAVEALRRVPDAETEATAARVNLAEILNEKEAFEEARALLEEALEQQAARGDNPHHTLDVLANLLNKTGNLADAVSLQRQALERAREAVQTPHHLLVTRLNNLAIYVRQAGDMEEAESLLRQTIEMCRELYPDGLHPQVGVALNELGNLQRDRGDNAGSLESFLGALELAERSHGPVSSRVATVLTNMSISLRNLERFEEAEAAMLRAVSISDEIEGPESMAAATLKNALAGYYEDTGQLERAREVQVEVIRVLRLNFGDAHHYVGIAINNLASLERERGDLEAAERYGREAVALHEEHGSPAPNRASARRNLAFTLAAQGRYEEAIASQRASIAVQEGYLEAEHPQIATAQARIARYLIVLGRHEEALEILEVAWPRVASAQEVPALAKAAVELALGLARSLAGNGGGREMLERALAVDGLEAVVDDPVLELARERLAQDRRAG